MTILAILCIAAMLAFFCMVLAMLGLVFKWVCGLVGACFSLVGSVLGLILGGVALAIAVPLAMLVLLPIWLPVIVCVALVCAWLRAGPARKAPVGA